jgi:DNA replication protein DnaC
VSQVFEARVGEGLASLGLTVAAQPSLDRRLFEELATERFPQDGRNLLLLGPPGVGKTRLSIGLGVCGAELGHRVYFTSAMELARKLTRAVDTNRLQRECPATTQSAHPGRSGLFPL